MGSEDSHDAAFVPIGCWVVSWSLRGSEEREGSAEGRIDLVILVEIMFILSILWTAILCRGFLIGFEKNSGQTCWRLV
jgi:hypothetical protein